MLAHTHDVSLLQVREGLEASWDERTSYLAVKEVGNPALGQCYPSARVVQFFFPETEIVKGKYGMVSRQESIFGISSRLGNLYITLT